LKKTTSKSLELARETIRRLSEPELRHAVGGSALVMSDDPATATTNGRVSDVATCYCLRK
jgi:hypothetical protein